MKRVFLGIISLVAVGSLQVSAQQSVIEVASDITMLCNCDQVTDGDTMKYKYSIVNSGNAAMTVPYWYHNGNGYTFVGTFDHLVEVTHDDFPSQPVYYSWINDDEVGVSMSIHDPATKQEIEYVMPGDTATVYVEDIVFMATRHKEGNNTIVVWPENYDGMTIPDSLRYTIEVVNSSGNASANNVNNPWVSKTGIYPNPANDRILINIPEELKNILSEITIQNAHGQVVKSFNGTYFELNVGDLATGHYTIGFNLNDQSRFSKPIVIEKK